MYVCASRFKEPDPDNPDYSLLEVQFYAWTPRRPQDGTDGVPEHGLFLRKNITTGKFELVREYDGPVQSRYEGQLRAFTHVESGSIHEVIFAGGLHQALLAGNAEYARIFGRRDLDDGMCVHRWPYRDELCPYPHRYDDESGVTTMNI